MKGYYASSAKVNTNIRIMLSGVADSVIHRSNGVWEARRSFYIPNRHGGSAKKMAASIKGALRDADLHAVILEASEHPGEGTHGIRLVKFKVKA